MTGRALSLLDGRMDHFLVGQRGLVAFKARLGDGLGEQFFIVRLVGHVAAKAFPRRHRRVNIFFLKERFLMALEAHVRRGFQQEF